MSHLFTPDQIAAMSAEIDAQLQELPRHATAKNETLRGGDTENLDQLFDKQFNTIAKATNQPGQTFLKNFAAAAKGELCGKDGTLYKQWQKWSDLTNAETIAVFGLVLDKMGVSVSVMPALIAALAVVVLRLGLTAFCKTFGE